MGRQVKQNYLLLLLFGQMSKIVIKKKRRTVNFKLHWFYCHAESTIKLFPNQRLHRWRVHRSPNCCFDESKVTETTWGIRTPNGDAVHWSNENDWQVHIFDRSIEVCLSGRMRRWELTQWMNSWDSLTGTFTRIRSIAFFGIMQWHLRKYAVEWRLTRYRYWTVFGSNWLDSVESSIHDTKILSSTQYSP